MKFKMSKFCYFSLSTASVAMLTATVVAIASESQAQAATLQFTANLSGAAESPANASPATGIAQVILDNIAHTMQVQATFSGLTGTTTAAHIHSATIAPFTGTAAVATATPTFPGFPSGVTSGTYINLFDLTQASSYSSAFVTANGGTTAGAEAALQAGLLAGKAYFNIHTSTFGGGEIRGFFVQQSTSVPEPFTMIGTLIGGVAAIRMRKKLNANKD
jgi:CHRD domain